MAKHLRPISESYTDYGSANNAEDLGRGLQKGQDGNAVVPAELSDYIAKTARPLLRQVIAVLDKTVKKKRRLSHMHPIAYRDRVLLAEALWDRLSAKLKEMDPAAKWSDLVELRPIWDAKAHPYAEFDVKVRAPLNDKNGKAIAAFREADGPDDQVVTAKDLEGQWYSTFWQMDGDEPDYGKIADRIFEHLFEQESQITGKPRRKGSVSIPADRETKLELGKLTENGLVSARGDAIANSVSDPRKPAKKPLLVWGEGAEKRYFGDDGKGGGDIAASIYAELSNLDAYNEPIYASWFGARLYDHFGGFKESLPEEKKDPFKLEVWNLHNSVRQFYQGLAKTERFRIAVKKVREDNPNVREVKALLPADRDALLAVLRGKKDNSEMSEVIRLGKLFVHASDVLHDKELDGEAALTAIRQRVAFLATSIGQSEIKQTESFARTWRGAVALSIRTAKGLADPEGKIKTERTRTDPKTRKVTKVDDRDIAVIANSRKAVDEFDSDQFRIHIPVIFGTKAMPVLDGQERASLLLGGGNAEAQKEILWGVLRLVANVRNRTNHFNVRRAMLGMLKGGIIRPLAPDRKNLTVHERRGTEVSELAIAAFDELLKFDLAVQKDAVRTALKRIKAEDFLTNDQLKLALGQLFASDDITSVGIPRFGAVMDLVRRLSDNKDVAIDQNLRGLSQCQSPKSTQKKRAMTEDEKTRNEAARCRNGLLMEMYQSGFRAWFSDQNEDAEKSRKLCHEVVERVATSKDARRSEYDGRTGRFYRAPTSFIDDLDLKKYDSLDDLLKALAAASMREQGLDVEYSPDGRVQSKVMNRIEAFRQEVFAHLFSKYIGERDCDWIYELSDRSTSATLEKVFADFAVPDQHFAEPWHSQFYTWLYMVPPSEASRLRHQMRKSAALDGKWSSELTLTVGDAKTADADAQKMLAQMDRLFSLYTKVQAAGFMGTEHEAGMGTKELFYENPDDFKAVYAPGGLEDHHTSFPGTMRGLRQLVRYAHLDALRPTFGKHKVTDAEVTMFAGLHTEARKDPETIGVVQKREDLRATILQAVKDKSKKNDRFWSDLESTCGQYKAAAIQTAVYNFQANGARLNDHVRLHQLMMRVVGRLTDFTLMWERDRLFAFVGMLYRQAGEDGFKLKRLPAWKQSRPDRIGLLLSKDLAKAMRKEFATWDEAQRPRNDILAQLEADLEAGFIPFLDTVSGFDASHFHLAYSVLKGERASAFRRHFLELDAENPKDDARRDLSEAKNEMPQPAFPNRSNLKSAIRNDFAHHNLLDQASSWGGPNLTQAMNAVRSLLSYDRKLKNAVSKAIKKILMDEGMMIQWTMNADRLKNPLVYPLSETHLTMVLQDKMKKPVSFTLPRASVRLVSMAKAVFDHGRSGYVEDKTIAGRVAKVVSYPDVFTVVFPYTPEGLKTSTRIIFASESR